MLIASRWLWRDRSLPARAARAALLPAAGLYGGFMALRRRAYRAGLVKRHPPVLPTIAVGNLTVGGSGKTPLVQWIARRLLGRGYRPGIVLRGYGGDETLEHRRAVPGAAVVEEADRHAGVRLAAVRGANVAILDDALQRLDVRPQLTLALVSAESAQLVPWPLPAGPWREPWSALARADVVVVTRKAASRTAADAVAARVRRTHPHLAVAQAAFALTGFAWLEDGAGPAPQALAGRRVVAVAGIADPDSFAAQLRALGATVRLLGLRDHVAYDGREMELLLQSGGKGDYVVITEKDAVKLRRRWPKGTQQPLVARLGLEWEAGADVIEHALDDVVTDRADIATTGAHDRG